MSLVQTLMQPLRAQYQGSLDRNESRPSIYGAWDFFNRENALSTGIFTQDIRTKIKSSFGNSVQIPVIDANSENVQITNVRSCTVADEENTSKLMTLTFATFVFNIVIYPSQYGNNDIAMGDDFRRKLNDRLIKLAGILDTRCVTTLEANKNTFWTGIEGSPYAQAANALQVSQAEKNDFYNNMPSILRRMNFFGNPKTITSPHGEPMVRRLNAQGSQNATNEQFQLPPHEWFWTNSITPAEGVESSGFMVQEGSVALETRIDFDAQLGHSIGDVMKWERVMIPIPNSAYGIEAAVFSRKDCADGSALQSGTAANTATLRNSYQYSFDMVFAVAYNSDPNTRFGPIGKYEISNS